MAQRIAIAGAGGMAREVRWLIEAIDRDHVARTGAHAFEFAGYLVANAAHLGPYDSRDHILGDDAWLEAHAGDLDALALGIADPRLRMKVQRGLAARAPKLAWPALVHPRAELDLASCTLAEGVMLCSTVLATVNITFEPFALVNPLVTIGHESRIGRGSVINHSANISGGVTIGAGVLVGIGARVLQYLDIGDGAVVGAGAVVTKNVPAGETVVGMPAKPLPRRDA